MDAALLSLLQSCDTPTICNAIEVAEGQRGFQRFSRQPPFSTDPGGKPLVGRARTATLSAQAPPAEAPDVVRQRRMDYYRYMACAPAPAIAVIEDLDWPDCTGAYWGEINTRVHRGFGLAGTLTNGLVRDLGDLPDNYPVLAGSVGPSHAFVHVRSIDVPVKVFGLTIEPGELVHADRHGAVVIPEALIEQMPAAIHKLLDTERIILDATRAEDFDFERFEAAWAAFERART